MVVFGVCMTPEVSVLSTVFRPGGIDVLLAGMRDQTFKDFEVILVDRRYEKRHKEVQEMAWGYDVPLLHVPEHRRNGKWVSFASAWNTAIALARGRVGIFLADWMYTPPGWIEGHLKALDGQRRYVAGSYRFVPIPELVLKQPYDFEAVVRKWEAGFECTEESPVARGEILDEMYPMKAGRFQSAWLPHLMGLPVRHQDLRMTELRRTGGSGLGDGWLHIKNDSVCRDVMWELNGLDERLERGRGPLDIDLQYRLLAAHVELWWAPEVSVCYLDPHMIDPALPFGSSKPIRLEGRWSWPDGLAYVERRKAEMQAGGSPRALNPWSMDELSELLTGWRTTASVPINDVDNFTYWNGREIWPDSEP